MLVAGAKRHAKEVLEIFHLNQRLENLFFFDDISEEVDDFLFGKYPIIKTLEDARRQFLEYPEFVIGIGNPYLRKKISEKLTNMGGILTSIIAKSANVGHYEVQLAKGLNIMHNVMISNCVTIGEGSLINSYSSIHHDVKVGKYSEISPCSVLLGGCCIGDFCFIGSHSTILPDVRLGNNVTVGAGAVVIKDVPDNSVAVGVPAKVIKLKEFNK
jgi:sugar O-acyltransferase (sialic acid O-acetyltransferase NeuD family)